jgi:hypothetical protein
MRNKHRVLIGNQEGEMEGKDHLEELDVYGRILLK